VLDIQQAGALFKRYTSDMWPLNGVIQTRPRVLARLQNFRKRLYFLFGNYGMALLWPIVALVIAAVGWKLALSSLERDKLLLEKQVQDKAEVLADSYASHLSLTLEEIDRIALPGQPHQKSFTFNDLQNVL
jgi:hypothetical protein